MTMMINPCICGPDGRVAGCVTPAVMDAFRAEYVNLASRYGMDPAYSDDALSLGEALDMSEDMFDATFLNAMREAAGRLRADMPDDPFAREVNRAYRSLLRLCCSKGVYDEAMSEAIGVLSGRGILYVGAGRPGDGMLSFTAGQVPVYIEMQDEDALYGLWRDDHSRRVVAYVCGNRVSMTHSGDIFSLCDAVSALVDDFSVDGDEAAWLSDRDRLRMLVDAARALVEESRDGLGGGSPEIDDALAWLDSAPDLSEGGGF